MIGIPIKYSDFYGPSIPKNPINLILGIPKDEIIATISAVNTRLKPIYNAFFDDSRETQIECIRAIFLDLNNPANNGISKGIINKFVKYPDNYTLFTRVTCLYAFQEVININTFSIVTPKRYTFQQRENIFKFLLIANENILLFDKANKQSDLDKLKDDYFEFFMFNQLPHNQYFSFSNPMNLFYKSWSLFNTLSTSAFFGPHLKTFLNINFGTNDLTSFYKSMVSLYFKSNDDNLKIAYLKVPLTNHNVLTILKTYSKRNNLKIPKKNALKIFEFLEIKKSPLFWAQNINKIQNTTTFIILDSILFIEKTYSLFINDFWFDYLKPNNICNRKDWGNFIGSMFYEPFLNEIFHSTFKYNKRVTVLSIDQLKLNKLGKSEIELCDFYIRDRNEVILAEAKSNYLPFVNRYKEVNTIRDYKNLDLDKFYKDYGLSQLVNKTIKLFNEYKSIIKDTELQKKGKLKIYPLLIVNDPIFSSGYSFFAFRRKFIIMLKKNKIEIDNEYYRIMPLSIINVSELQDLEQSLKDRTQTIFNIFKMLFSLTKNITFEKRFDHLKTLTHVINKRIDSEKIISKRIRSFKWLGY